MAPASVSGGARQASLPQNKAGFWHHTGGHGLISGRKAACIWESEGVT